MSLINNQLLMYFFEELSVLFSTKMVCYGGTVFWVALGYCQDSLSGASLVSKQYYSRSSTKHSSLSLQQQHMVSLKC